MVIELDRVRRNIAHMAEITRDAGVAFRPHIKTHKMPQIAWMQLRAGARGVQTAKLGEAEVMRDAGITDILVGYPIVGRSKLARLAHLAEDAQVTVSLDSYDAAAAISRTLVGSGVAVRIVVEIDTGMQRIGVAPGSTAADLAERVAVLPSLDFAGILTHEGHVCYQARDHVERKEMTEAACQSMLDSAEEIRLRGLDCDLVSAGSTGTARFAVRCPGITEVRAGAYVFNDGSQLLQGAACEDDLAAFVVATVVSRPNHEWFVIDAGSKVLGADRLIVRDPPTTFGSIWGRPNWRIVRLSEEHGVVQTPPGEAVSIGERLLVVPNHICPAINLAETVAVFENHVTERWPVAARGRVQ
ncbi:MAG: alanine racemase [Actinobacteria bacterium]|nr:alanine racemase [Actinomycetota bacterium]